MDFICIQPENLSSLLGGMLFEDWNVRKGVGVFSLYMDTSMFINVILANTLVRLLVSWITWGRIVSKTM